MCPKYLLIAREKTSHKRETVNKILDGRLSRCSDDTKDEKRQRKTPPQSSEDWRDTEQNGLRWGLEPSVWTTALCRCVFWVVCGAFHGVKLGKEEIGPSWIIVTFAVILPPFQMERSSKTLPNKAVISP